MSKPGKVLRNLCKRLKVRLTVKRGKKRVYKSIKVLKAQCANKKKKVKRKFGSNYWKTKRYLDRRIPIYMSSLKAAVLLPKAAYRLWNKKKKKKANKKKKSKKRRK